MTYVRTRNRAASRIAPVALIALIVSPLAHADLVPTLISGPIVDGSNFAYNYQVDLLPDESLNPTATAGVTCPGPGKTLVQCVPTGTFVTIYDISGFVSASASNAGWGETATLTGETPSTINGAAFDDPTLENVTFFYTGPEVDAFVSEVSFTGFQIVSTIDSTADGVYSSQATIDIGTVSGNTDQADGPVTVPAGGLQTVPEPASLAVWGGLILLGVHRRFFRRL